jgi:glycyl-tRNA synthetase beta chain
MDSLFGIFAIGLQPTGDKDPFALRRASLGIIRTLVENKLDIDLLSQIEQAAKNYPNDLFVKSDSAKFDSAVLLKFINERFKGYLLDQAISADVFDSVAALKLANPYEIYLRVQAVNHFKALAEAKSLAAANKRISNILKKNKLESGASVDSQLLVEESEKSLNQSISAMEQPLAQLLSDRNYTEYLVSLSNLHQKIDDFFDNVMVLCDDEKLKNNRIALVSSIHALFIKIADLSLLQ